jgi:hypothetical protein
VYEHWRTDTNEPFYVGKGNGRRAYEMKWRKNPYHERVVSFLKENGFEVKVKIFIDHLTEQQSFDIEQVRIAFWKSTGVKLTNCTNGGEGISGHKHTPEVCEIIRKRHTGVVCSPDRRAKISASTRGRTFSPETLKKMSDSQKVRAVANPGHMKSLCEAAALANKSPENKEKQASAVRKALKGKTRPAEVCAKISASSKGKIVSQESIEKMRLAKIGSKQSSATVAKRVATIRERRAAGMYA